MSVWLHGRYWLSSTDVLDLQHKVVKVPNPHRRKTTRTPEAGSRCPASEHLNSATKVSLGERWNCSQGPPFAADLAGEGRRGMFVVR